MKLIFSLVILFFLIGCSNSDQPVYKGVIFNDDVFEFIGMVEYEPTNTMPDKTIIVDDISNFVITGADLDETAFPDLHILMFD